jgi:hypothetical protein
MQRVSASRGPRRYVSTAIPNPLSASPLWHLRPAPIAASPRSTGDLLRCSWRASSPCRNASPDARHAYAVPTATNPQKSRQSSECAPERHETMPKVETHPSPTTRCSSAMMMLLWLHSGVLRYQQRTSPLPLWKTLFLATVTVDTCCAWALCSLGGHGNILFSWRFHDSHSYLLVMASVLLLEFVTLTLHRVIAPEASYFVTLSHVLWERPRRVTRSPRATPPGQGGATRAGSRGQVCRSIPPSLSPETAAPTCRQNDG